MIYHLRLHNHKTSKNESHFSFNGVHVYNEKYETGFNLIDYALV